MMNHAEQIAFNTRMAKELKRLKKDAGASTIRQNYRGTGSQKHRRQLWTNFHNGAVIDIWIETGCITLGGVVSRIPTGQHVNPSNRVIAYQGREPEAIYADVLASLLAWMAVPAAI
jgi:hypothetical protein